MLKRNVLFLNFLMLLSLFSSFVRSEEPTLRQLERAALRYAGMDPAEAVHWKSRARWAPALPKVLVGYEQKSAVQVNNTIQDSISVTSSGISIGPPDSSFHQDDDFNQGFEVRATWNLDELIFNKDSLAISAESRYRTIVQTQIIEELHQTYFERKKFLLREGERKPEEFPAIKRLQLEELEARLDSLTGGYFSKITYGGKNEI
jgi:hypothetical protein